jgi:hypothetical protein
MEVGQGPNLGCNAKERKYHDSWLFGLGGPEAAQVRVVRLSLVITRVDHKNYADIIKRRNVSNYVLAMKTACNYKERGTEQNRAEHRSRYGNTHSCDEDIQDFDDGRDQLHVQGAGTGNGV